MANFRCALIAVVVLVHAISSTAAAQSATAIGTRITLENFERLFFGRPLGVELGTLQRDRCRRRPGSIQPYDCFELINTDVKIFVQGLADTREVVHAGLTLRNPFTESERDRSYLTSLSKVLMSRLVATVSHELDGIDRDAVLKKLNENAHGEKGDTNEVQVGAWAYLFAGGKDRHTRYWVFSASLKSAMPPASP